MTPLEYVGRGWRIFPVYEIAHGRCACSAGSSCENPGKHPRTSSGVHDATSDPDQVERWLLLWPSCNWALATGAASGAWVLDVDPRHGGYESLDQLEAARPDGPLPSTLTVTSGGGGRHLFFAYPEDGTAIRNCNNWRAGLDVRSDGYYVVLPPSNHISGGRYVFTDPRDAVHAPPDLVRAVNDAGRTSSTTTSLPRSDDVLRGVPEGLRDDTLFRFACRLRRQLGDDGYEVTKLALLAAAANCDPVFPESQAIKCLDSAWSQDRSEAVNDPLAFTDLRNSERFVDRFGDVLRYVVGIGWLSWSSRGWQRDAEYATTLGKLIPQQVIDEGVVQENERARRSFVRWGQASGSSGRISALVNLAQSDPRVLRQIDEFDQDPEVIAVSNGLVNLRTGELRPLTRNDAVTLNTGVVYDPDYPRDRWLSFLRYACDGDEELVRYMQLAAGYTITGSTEEESFFILSGPPASGKSTFVDGLTTALGEYAMVSQAETFMYRRGQRAPEGELARMTGKRLVTMSEIGQGELFNAALVKQFTGRDVVVGRLLYQEAFEYRPTCKLWIATNHDPDAKDDALWRRIKKVPFHRVVPAQDRDPELKNWIQDPDAGARAVLAWAVEGASAWLRDRKLAEPSRVVSEILEYKMAQDRFGTFVDECIEQNETASVKLAELFQLYRTWYKSIGEYPLRVAQFTSTLRLRGFRVVRAEQDSQTYVHGARLKAQQVLGNGGMSWG